MPQAPNLTLPDVNGSDISLTQFRGKPVVLTIAGKDSARQATDVTEAITVRLNDSVQLVCVMDLRNVPKLVRGMAKRAVARTYNDAVKGLSAARERAGVRVPDDPAQLVVMLRDTDGKAADAFGLDVDHEVAAVLVDAQGNIVTVGRGSRAADDIVRALA